MSAPPGPVRSAARRFRRLLRSIPRGARVCAVVAFLNAACWSLLTPPFQVPDEPDHFAYVQTLAETQRLPSSSGGRYAQEETTALLDLHYPQVRLRPANHPIFLSSEQRKLEGDLAEPLSRAGSGETGVSASEPPLYYALQTIPYRLGSSGSILDRLELMRLLSALMAGLTALFAYLFLREALPAAPWAWTVGGLGVAFAPLLGFISGGVNPDAMLASVCAAGFYCLARGFRRGLSFGLAMALGGLVAIGLLTKLNFIGFAPGIVLGLVLLARRQARREGRAVYRRLLAPALLIAVSPAVLYGVINLISGHATFGIASSGGHALETESVTHELSYIWQFYLPRLPGMHNFFGQISTTRQIWFRDLVGMYGWFDVEFPGWVYSLALILAGAIAVLCVRELVRVRGTLRRRAGELLVYALMSVGVLMLVGASGYLESSAKPTAYGEPRYMLPMIALWGAVLALAARGAGRRWGPAVGALLIALVIGHDLFSQLQTIARYYS